MSDLQVRLPAWTVTAIGGKVTKAALREAVRHDVEHPSEPFTLEMVTIGSVTERGGQYLSLGEAHRHGIRTIEVRYNDDRDVAVITIHPSGEQAVVS